MSNLNAKVLKLLIIFFLVALTGCATKWPIDTSARSLPMERHFSKNYTKNIPRTVNVGDAIVFFKDYLIEPIEVNSVVPENSVQIDIGSKSFNFQKNKAYDVLGRVDFDGVEYSLIEMNPPLTNVGSVRAAFLIEKNGLLSDKLAVIRQNEAVIVSDGKMKISDGSIRFVRETRRDVKNIKGDKNFEIIYTGVNSSGLNFVYREFTDDDRARVAFYQNLTYEPGAKVIAFKKYRFSIVEANSQFITFIVTADD